MSCGHTYSPRLNTITCELLHWTVRTTDEQWTANSPETSTRTLHAEIG